MSVSAESLHQPTRQRGGGQNFSGRRSFVRVWLFLAFGDRFASAIVWLLECADRACLLMLRVGPLGIAGVWGKVLSVQPRGALLRETWCQGRRGKDRVIKEICRYESRLTMGPGTHREKQS